MSHSSESIITEHSLQHPRYRQHPHSKDADKYWQTRFFYFNQCNANKFWKNCFLKMHSSTGHTQPNVNWQHHVKGKHLHTLKLKVCPYQQLAYSRCLHKNWEGLSLVTSFYCHSIPIKGWRELKKYSTFPWSVKALTASAKCFAVCRQQSLV